MRRQKDDLKGQRALVTGASSGIGLAVAERLLARGCFVVGASRHEGNFAKLRAAYPDRTDYVVADLSRMEDVTRLIEALACQEVNLLVANAGFGCFGDYRNERIDEREIQMVQVNCLATQRLIKAYLRRFDKTGGRILVTASAAAFGAAPYMAAYYATKAYIYRLCLGYQREMKIVHSRAELSILCPGPVATGFEKAGDLKFQFKPMDVGRVADYALKKWLKNKAVIVPGFAYRLLRIGAKIAPDSLITKVTKKAAV